MDSPRKKRKLNTGAAEDPDPEIPFNKGFQCPFFSLSKEHHGLVCKSHFISRGAVWTHIREYHIDFKCPTKSGNLRPMHRNANRQTEKEKWAAETVLRIFNHLDNPSEQEIEEEEDEVAYLNGTLSEGKGLR